MAIAALVIAIIAALIALATAAYTRTQALAAKGSLAIEQRRHDVEVTPRYDPVLEHSPDGPVLRLTSRSQQPMEAIEATIVSGYGVEFDASRRLDPAGWISSKRVAVWNQPLFQDKTASWAMYINYSSQFSNDIALDVVDRADPKKRVVHVTVKVPPRPDMSQAERASRT